MPTTWPARHPGWTRRGTSPPFVVIALGIAAFEVGRLIRSASHDDDEPDGPPEGAAGAESSRLSRPVVARRRRPGRPAVHPRRRPGDVLHQPDGLLGDRRHAAFDSTVLPILRAIAWVPALVVLHRIISRRRAHPDVKLNGPEVRRHRRRRRSCSCSPTTRLTSSRYAFGSMALSVAVLLGACATVKRARRTMLLLILGFVVVFPLADTFRRPETGAVEVSVLDEYSGNPDYDAFGQISNSIAVVRDEGFSYLTQPLGVVLLLGAPRRLAGQADRHRRLPG